MTCERALPFFEGGISLFHYESAKPISAAVGVHRAFSENICDGLSFPDRLGAGPDRLGEKAGPGVEA